MKRQLLTAAWLVAWMTTGLVADEYRVDVIAETAPADALAEPIAARLAATGLRVVKGENSTVCEIWPCKDWPTIPNFEATVDRLYPFETGELLGVVRLRRRGSDFRDQDISRGVYTLRYGMQPVDGNHVGTSPTRDFVLLVRAEDDQSAERLPPDQLLKASAAAAGANHPAMLCLQKLTDDAAAPSVRELESHPWWVLRLAGQTQSEQKALPIDIVVVGHAEE